MKITTVRLKFLSCNVISVLPLLVYHKWRSGGKLQYGWLWFTWETTIYNKNYPQYGGQQEQKGDGK